MAEHQLTAEDALAIYQAVRNGEPQAVLAAEFGITQQSVSAINTGASWSSVTGQAFHATHRAQLTVDDVRAIDEALKAGVSNKVLAQDYAVSNQAISNIKCGRDWVWVTGRAPKRRSTT